MSETSSTVTYVEEARSTGTVGEPTTVEGDGYSDDTTTETRPGTSGVGL